MKRFKPIPLQQIKQILAWLNPLITFPKNTIGLFVSLWYFKGKPSKAKQFYGYWHWELAKKYAHKRFNWWPAKFNQQGKWQGVFANGDESLIVISPKEIKLLKKRKFIKTQKWYTKIFKFQSLYTVTK